MIDAAIKNTVKDTGIFMQDMEERLRYINRQMAIMDYNTDISCTRFSLALLKNYTIQHKIVYKIIYKMNGE